MTALAGSTWTDTPMGPTASLRNVRPGVAFYGDDLEGIAEAFTRDQLDGVFGALRDQ